MRNARAILLFAGLLLAWAPPSMSDESTGAHNSPQLESMDPLQFLEYLKSLDGEFQIVTIWKPVKGWIKVKHLPALIALLDSTVKCAPVVDAHSNFLPRFSTIGNEAGLMIISFRGGEYPSELVAPQLDAGKRAELIEWWEKESAKISLTHPGY